MIFKGFAANVLFWILMIKIHIVVCLCKVNQVGSSAWRIFDTVLLMCLIFLLKEERRTTDIDTQRYERKTPCA